MGWLTNLLGWQCMAVKGGCCRWVGGGGGGSGGGDACADDAAGLLASAGATCAQVVPLGCQVDLNTLNPLAPVGTLVNLVCPLSCNTCGGGGGGSSAPSPSPSGSSGGDTWGAGESMGLNRGCISGKSCEELTAQYGEWPAGPYTPNTCGESDAGFFGDGEDDTAACVGADTNEGWQHAQAICFEVGARLCTLDELMAAVGVGTGCNHNIAQVWSSTPCGTGMMHMQNQWTSTEGDVWPSVQTCLPDDTSVAVRCCADGASIRGNRATCDQFVTW